MFVIIVETRPETASVVYHIQYTKLFLQKNPKYNYFSDMLKSNIRYNMIFFLEQLLNEGWEIRGQSQNKNSMFYTLILK